MVFCQNALKPHACYMYSGNAVRTAIAIGLANGSRITRTAEAKRTWWYVPFSGRRGCHDPPALSDRPLEKLLTNKSIGAYIRMKCQTHRLGVGQFS